jgi:hypothetical protein
MEQIRLDPQTCSQLRGATSVMDLCDEQGRLIGYFLSPDRYRRLIYDWANSQVTDEELKRCLDEPGGSRLAEIWERLRSQR